MKLTAAQRAKVNRATWLRDFEIGVVQKAPQHAGKIQWDTPIFFHNQGLRIEDAIDLYIRRMAGFNHA